MNDIITAAMAEEVVKNFSGRRILIVGDMVADIYLTGNISRISREAPVLVLEQADEKIVAGGAANVANNVATLGAAAYMIGITGDDRHGEKLKGILSDGGVNTEGIINDKERPTITKTRIIAGGRATVSQQIVRIDNEAKTSLSSKIETKLITLVKQILPRMEAVVLSDYGSGTITPTLRDYILTYCRANTIPTIADSRYAISEFTGVDYIKQNDAELASAVGAEPPLPSEELTAAGDSLRRKLAARGILVTRGENGMTLLEENRRTDIPVSDMSEVYDVSGAGDTCVAAFILGLAAGATPVESSIISNVASGIAVRKLGTATVSHAELSHALGVL